MHYMEHQYYAAGEGTMGDVAALLMKIGRRSLAMHWLLAHGESLITFLMVSGYVGIVLVLVCSFFEDETNAALFRGLHEVKGWYEDVSWIVECWSYRALHLLVSICNFIGYTVRAAALVSFALGVAWILGRAEDRRRWNGR